MRHHEFKAVDTVISSAPFWVVFAVFFPAVTGIEAGISLSGDLENPSKSLPWGTLSAVFIGYLVYMAVPFFLSSYKIPREVLISNQMIIRDASFAGELILLGIWGATLSSALGCILGAPRTLQALARDRILPGLLGKGFGETDSPRIATIFTFIIAMTAVLLGDINALAPILTMFFLTSYAVLNLSAGIETLIANPSWRPSFRTSWVVSFLGTALCVIVMFMINSGATFIAAAVIVLIFYVMTRRKMTAHWSDIRRSLLIYLARNSIYRLGDADTDPQHWRPNILVFCGSPAQRFYLIQLADAITHGKSFLTVASIVPECEAPAEREIGLKNSVKEYLKKNNVPAFVEVTFAESVIEGAKEIVKTYGFGALAPNTFMMGETEKKDNYVHFSELIKYIYQSKRNIVIVREGVRPVRKAKKRKHKKICVWWGGKLNNTGLMLVLGYMLNVSPEWKESELSIKTIVDDEKDYEARLESAKEFVTESRLHADIEVLIKDPGTDAISFTILNASKYYDLVFLGMKPPGKDETDEEYAKYYETLLTRTNNFPPTAFVLASEDIKFSDVFK